LEPQPLARAAIRWLRANPPPPPKQVTVVHGDYRTGNFMHDGAGDILALLDWEMVHLGDPLEDIAWAIDPLWCWFDRDRPGLMIPRFDAISVWENASGLKVDLVALHWWELFSHIKGLAIWITAGETYEKSDNKDATLAFSSLVCTDIHNQVLAEKMPILLGIGLGSGK
jgi:aminoglycoside phosphotransferase (APT) family kinase protein